MNILTQERRNQLYALLGELPDRSRPISAKSLGSIVHEEIEVEQLILDLNGLESVPALFARPKGDGPFPCVLFNHSHGGNYAGGKRELLIGRDYLFERSYLKDFVERGYAVLCIDHWLFGERRGRTESELFKHMLWHGQVLWGMMVFDSLRAVDYLCTRTDINHARLATVGMSMGSNMAQWLAALEPRISVCVDICCLTDFDALIDARGLDGHGVYYYVPSLLRHFTAADVNGLIAPRAHLSLAGNYDRLTPPAGLARIDAALKNVYGSQQAQDHWRLLRYDVAHFETAEMRWEVMRWLERFL